MARSKRYRLRQQEELLAEALTETGPGLVHPRLVSLDPGWMGIEGTDRKIEARQVSTGCREEAMNADPHHTTTDPLRHRRRSADRTGVTVQKHDTAIFPRLQAKVGTLYHIHLVTGLLESADTAPRSATRTSPAMATTARDRERTGDHETPTIGLEMAGEALGTRAILGTAIPMTGRIAAGVTETETVPETHAALDATGETRGLAHGAQTDERGPASVSVSVTGTYTDGEKDAR